MYYMISHEHKGLYMKNYPPFTIPWALLFVSLFFFFQSQVIIIVVSRKNVQYLSVFLN